MSYSCLEELQVSLNLHLSDKTKVLSNAGCRYNDNWFIVTDDGNCYLFDRDGNLDDIAKVKWLDKNCIKRDIKKIIVPSNVMSIKLITFYGCKCLTSVTIPDSVTSIESYAFDSCCGLRSITIGNGVTNIGRDAFYGCSSLTNVTIGIGMTSIGQFTFYDCANLTSVTIPEGVTSIGVGAFESCSNLKSLVFKGKTFEEVQSMKNYPFGIEDQSIMQVE